MQFSEVLLAAATGVSLLAVYEIATDYRVCCLEFDINHYISI